MFAINYQFPSIMICKCHYRVQTLYQLNINNIVTVINSNNKLPCHNAKKIHYDDIRHSQK